MKKNIVKINENILRQIVAESVKKVLRENNDEIQFELNTICEKMKSEFGVDGVIKTDGDKYRDGYYYSIVFSSGESIDSPEGVYMSEFQIELLYRIFQECDALGKKIGADTPIYISPKGEIAVYFTWD